ncbi:MAG: thiamine pyrophosphate-dependent enzyme [Candidatus Ornithomonoglobus sp.]
MSTYTKPKSILDKPFHYCPGCGHGIVHRIIGEVMDELGIENDTVAVVPVGCAVMAYDYFACDCMEAAHGRAPAVATGVKRCMPDKVVFSYQGDGDLAAIGTAETIHAAARGEAITVIFINNTIYGMTGGQMAPTTLPGQVTQTTPYGRDPYTQGFPLKMCEIMNQLEGPAYIERCAVDTPADIRATKRAVKKAFEYQIDQGSYSFIEILSPCPTNWKMNPVEAMARVGGEMKEYYPTGVFRDSLQGIK